MKNLSVALIILEPLFLYCLKSLSNHALPSRKLPLALVPLAGDSVVAGVGTPTPDLQTLAISQA